MSHRPLNNRYKTMSAITLVLVSAHLPASAPPPMPDAQSIGTKPHSGDTDRRSPLMCSIQTLTEQPDYLYPVSHIRQMVRDAEVVVRAVAVDSLPRSPADSMTLSEVISPGFPESIVAGLPEIRFRSIEVLRGTFPAAAFTYRGIVTDEDDFNTLPVPYRMVRSAGQRGDCYAKDYRPGGEYLFLLARRTDVLTPHWFPLGPTNEQIRADDDLWLQWVREQLAEDPGMADQPPLR